MAWYRFKTPLRQSSFVDFGIAVGDVCQHLKAWGIQIQDVRVRANALAFNTSADIPVPEDLNNLDLEAG